MMAHGIILEDREDDNVARLDYAVGNVAAPVEDESESQVIVPVEVQVDDALDIIDAVTNETTMASTIVPIPPQPLASSSLPHSYTPIGWNAVLRKALTDPAREWRNVPEEYRNEKFFILQFLHKSNLLQLDLPTKDDFERKFPFSLRQDRDIIYAISQRYDFAKIYATRHIYVPEQYKDDKRIMLSYCKTVKRSLQECTYRLQDDIDIVTAAIQNDGMELQYASYDIQQNEMIVREACRSNICALNFCSSPRLRDQLLGDFDFVVQMLRTAGKRDSPDVVGDQNEVPGNTTEQVEYAKKILRHLSEPLRSNKKLLLVAIEFNILSYVEVAKHAVKYTNDIEFLIDSLSCRASVYLELCQIPSKEEWYKSIAPAIPTAPPVNSCGSGACSINVDANLHRDSHRIAYATITSPTSDATIIAKVLENIPTFLTSPEYNSNEMVHKAIVDRAAIAYVRAHLQVKFPYLCSNVEVMTRAIQRDCNLFVLCTEKDDPSIVVVAMRPDTAYPLLRTKSIDYISEHANDVLLQVINISDQYQSLEAFMPDYIWNNNLTLQKAWIKRKGIILQRTIQLLQGYSSNDEENHQNDVIRDMSLYIAEHNGEQFFAAPLSLKSDLNFMMTAIQLSSGVAMKYGCPNTIQQNIECAVHTIAHSEKDRVFTFIRKFTPEQIWDHLQKAFSYHDSFVNPILCTIYQKDSVKMDSGAEERLPKSPLSILNCGHETSTALLQRIALFTGVPIGPTFEVYEKAFRIMSHYMNVLHTPNTTATNRIAAPTPNVTVQRPPTQAPVARARMRNVFDLHLNNPLRLHEVRIRAGIRRQLDEIDADVDDDDDGDFAGLRPDFVDDMLEEAFLDDLMDAEQIPGNEVVAAAAVPNPDQPPHPDIHPNNEMERFILANAIERPRGAMGQPPFGAFERLFGAGIRGPAALPLGFHERHAAMDRALARRRRRRLRIWDGQPRFPDDEENDILRMLQLRPGGHRQPP